MRQVGLILVVGLLVAIMLTAVFILIGRFFIQDTSIPLRDSLISEGSPKTILTFFSHPDDEIAVAGTLAASIDQGHEVVLICLTKGGAGPTGDLVDREVLGEVRTKELHASGTVLGAKAVEIFDFPDGGLQEVEFSELKNLAFKMIEKYRPDVLITYDSEVGLYGHPDHRVTARAMEECLKSVKNQSDFKMPQYFQVTLSSKQIDLAMKLSSGFKKNYPKEGKGLPSPDFSVNTTPYFFIILDMIATHQTQQEVLRDLLPYHDKIPKFIYSRIFDREYFHEKKISAK
jgi:LmbE family N-acetylglucosaminyl deacetylase